VAVNILDRAQIISGPCSLTKSTIKLIKYRLNWNTNAIIMNHKKENPFLPKLVIYLYFLLKLSNKPEMSTLFVQWCPIQMRAFHSNENGLFCTHPFSIRPLFLVEGKRQEVSSHLNDLNEKFPFE